MITHQQFVAPGDGGFGIVCTCGWCSSVKPSREDARAAGDLHAERRHEPMRPRQYQATKAELRKDRAR